MEIEKPNKTRLLFYSTIITLIGIALRTYHLLRVGFEKPWKFGGLYLEFARQIFQNNYLLPETIPHYTQGGLPFAYPPLPFYIESFLVFTLGLPEFLVVNLLPVLISVISLLLFYIVIKKILKDQTAQLICLTLYSFFPIAYAEQLEGAGLAESFGTMFIILLVLAFWNFYQKPYKAPVLLLTAVVWALAVLASPASAYLSVLLFFTTFIMLIRKEKYTRRKLILYILFLGLAAILISSVYWVPVIRNHSAGVFIDSFVSQHDEGMLIIGFLIRLAEMHIIDAEPILSLLFLLALCTLAYYQKYEVLLLSFFAALIPRENWIMGIIGVLSIGYAIDLLLRNQLFKIFQFKDKQLSKIIIRVIVIAPILWSPLYFMLTREIVSEHTLDAEQILFLEEINQITALEENLIIIGNNEFLEWSPYLTEKTVLNVWYGTEFAPSKAWIYEFHESLVNCTNTNCINILISENFKNTALTVIIDLSFMGNFMMEDVPVYEVDADIKLIDDRFITYSINT